MISTTARRSPLFSWYGELFLFHFSRKKDFIGRRRCRILSQIVEKCYMKSAENNSQANFEMKKGLHCVTLLAVLPYQFFQQNREIFQ